MDLLVTYTYVSVRYVWGWQKKFAQKLLDSIPLLSLETVADSHNLVPTLSPSKYNAYSHVYLIFLQISKKSRLIKAEHHTTILD